jgi:translation elongation factor aEF-1 beta
VGVGTALFKIKLMPEAPSVDLTRIKEEAVKAIEEAGGKSTGFEEQPIAFGLVAVIASASLTEDKPGEVMEENLGKIEGVSSVEIIDYRRAIE